MKKIASIVSTLLLASLVFAQVPPPEPSSPPTNLVVKTIAERTLVKVALKEKLRSGDSKAGQEITFEVVADVFAPDGGILVKSGTPAYGVVTESKGAGMLGKGGKLQFTCDYVRMSDGTRIPMRSSEVISKKGGGKNGAINTVLFISPLGVFMKGRNVAFEKGAEFTVYVDKNTDIKVVGPPPTPAPTPTPTPTPPPPTPAPSGSSSKPSSASLILKSDNEEVYGELSRYSKGKFYISVGEDTVSFDENTIKSIYVQGKDKKFVFISKNGDENTGFLYKYYMGKFFVKIGDPVKEIPLSELTSIHRFN